jgi:hypothetical protein
MVSAALGAAVLWSNTVNIPTIKPEWLAGITMTQAQKDKWLAALRSGEYEQGTGCLCIERFDEYEFCCLGVACHAVLGRDREDMDCAAISVLSGEFESFLGPWNEGEDANDCPEHINSIQRALAYLNDHLELNFTEIADFIEEHIPACDAPVQP